MQTPCQLRYLQCLRLMQSARFFAWLHQPLHVLKAVVPTDCIGEYRSGLGLANHRRCFLVVRREHPYWPILNSGHRRPCYSLHFAFDVETGQLWSSLAAIAFSPQARHHCLSSNLKSSCTWPSYFSEPGLNFIFSLPVITGAVDLLFKYLSIPTPFIAGWLISELSVRKFLLRTWT